MNGRVSRRTYESYRMMRSSIKRSQEYYRHRSEELKKKIEGREYCSKHSEFNAEFGGLERWDESIKEAQRIRDGALRLLMVNECMLELLHKQMKKERQDDKERRSAGCN